MRNNLLLLLLTSFAVAAPLLNSWYTESSGQYARIWQTITDEASEKANGTITSVTTWDRTAYPGNSEGFSLGDQATNVYAGIQGLLYSDDYVYVESTGLATYTMGPWYDSEKTDAFGNEGTGTLFASWPGNQALIYKIPRNTPLYTSSYSNANPSATNIGNCGIFVDGVPLFNTLDTFSYDASNGADQTPANSFSGDDIWNRDAFTNEGPTFDSGNLHQAMENMHGHASPAALRQQLGDNVSYDPTVVFTGLDFEGGETSPYTENTSNFTHSPILAWVNDGLPMYGPYGYSDPLDPDSGVRRMITGYQKRDGSNNSTDLSMTGRTTLPQWKVDQDNNTTSRVLTSDAYGPDVSSDFVLGHYIEDYAYKGDLGLTMYSSAVAQSMAFDDLVSYDLNQYNVRWCVTPEFPEGTWAYFTNVDEKGVPVYPYNLSYLYFGDSSLASTTTNTYADYLNATRMFSGFSEKSPELSSIGIATASNEVSLVWSAVEGGDYSIETSTDLSTWSTTSEDVSASGSSMQTVISTDLTSKDRDFYRVTATGTYATYDDTPFGEATTGGPGGGGPGGR